MAELKELVRASQRISSTEDFDVAVTGTGVVSEPGNVLMTLISTIEALNYTGNQKIEAIRAFRTLHSCGLAEAKWIVENWATWKEMALRKGNFPTMTSGVGFSFSLT